MCGKSLTEYLKHGRYLINGRYYDGRFLNVFIVIRTLNMRPPLLRNF